MQQDYQKQFSMMTPEAKVQKEQELEAKARVFNERRMAAQKEIAEAEKAALDPIIEKLKVILQNTGKQRGLAMILDLRTVPYYDSSIDLTSEVVAAYNKANP
jgi:outer membrane protein